MPNEQQRVFLFLQGPITPFFKLIADKLEEKNHRVLRINFCFGDWLFWRRSGATNYRGRLQNWPAFISDFLDKEQVTDLILLGEQRDYHKIAIAEAKSRNIQIVATDFGYLRPDWITFELNGMSADSLFPREPKQIMSLAKQSPEPDLSHHYHDSFFTQAFWDMAYHLSSVFLWPLYPFYRSHQLYHPVLVYLGTGWHLLKTRIQAKKTQVLIEQLHKKQTPYFLFPLQMQNDFQIRVYSKYPNLETAIEEVMQSFADNAPSNSLLVIKVHPLDPYLINWRRYCFKLARQLGLADRIVFVDGGSLKSLLENSQGVVTINSTVGIWTLLVGKPLRPLGKAIYNIAGLIHPASLDEFWRNPVAPNISLRDAFIRALAGTIQIRGVYYQKNGLDAAVSEAVERLDKNLINRPLRTL